MDVKVEGDTGEMKAQGAKPNRAERRAKGRRLTIADIRGFHARMAMQKLFTPPKES